MQTVCAVNIEKLCEQDEFKTLVKLHQQFAQTPDTRFQLLLKDAIACNDEYQGIIGKIHKKCYCYAHDYKI